jgi:NodT family efflux transporter outer membrane factor (OMF) lipoprotein
VEGRYDRGLVSALELRLTRENRASAEAAVLALEGNLEQARLALDVLLGRRPGSSEGLAAAGLAPLPDLEPVPLGLPAELLERRPDLRAAEMRLVADTAGVGIALAQLFPGLTLTGAAGTRSDTLGDLVSSDGFVFNVVASLVAPLFDGGRRRAEVAAARARREESAALYAGTVLTALREVEDALVRDQTLRQRLTFLDTRVAEARAADRIARSRYQQGVLGLLEVLETERRLRSAEEALLNAQSELWNARIDLHLALGGDWGVEPQKPLPQKLTARSSVAESASELATSDTEEFESNRIEPESSH